MMPHPRREFKVWHALVVVLRTNGNVRNSLEDERLSGGGRIEGGMVDALSCNGLEELALHVAYACTKCQLSLTGVLVFLPLSPPQEIPETRSPTSQAAHSGFRPQTKCQRRYK